MQTSVISKYIFASFGALIGYLAPTGWLILACFLITLYDAYSAFQLSRRVKKLHPRKAQGKFKSMPAQKIWRRVLEVSVLIALAYFIEDKVLVMANFYLPYVAAGLFIFAQAWSILENMSSCNGSRWAKLLQTIMVDKTSRHFDIDPESLNKILNETDSDTRGPVRDNGRLPNTAKR